MNNIQEQRAALMNTLADMLDGLVSSISIDAQLVRPAAGKVAVFIEPRPLNGRHGARRNRSGLWTSSPARRPRSHPQSMTSSQRSTDSPNVA